MAAPADLPPPTPPPEGVRGAAREILSRPEFRQPPKSLYDRVVGWLGDLLDRAVSSLFAGGQSAVVGWTVLIVAVAVFGYLGWRLLRNARPAARQYAEDYRVATEQRRTAVEWEQDAASLERAGDWRGALRCRYRGLIARLGTAGVVDEIPGRTAGEYRRDVGSARPTAAAPFAQATDLFERAWYGGARTDRDDAERFRALASNVLVEANR